MERVTYNPHVFDQPDTESAMAIAITPEDGLSTEHRLANETPYLARLIGEQLGLAPGQLVVDYGCGPGRMAKALIERFDVKVLGVDISQNMRSFSPTYVGSPSFSVVSNAVARSLFDGGLRADAALAIWVLQHCPRPKEDLTLIREGLSTSGKLFVLNNYHRAVPTLEAGWVDDQLSIHALVAEEFSLTAEGQPKGAAMGPRLAAQTFWAVGAKR